MSEQEIKKLGFFSDPARTQGISGIAAASAIVVTFLSVFFLPSELISRGNIILTASLAFIFTLIYYSTPKLYLNKKLLLLPDVVYVLAISFVVWNLGPFGSFYIIFYLLQITIDAFIFDLKDFVAVVIFCVIAVILNNLMLQVEMQEKLFSLFIQVYSVITLATVLRLFAKEALGEKKAKEEISKIARGLTQEKAQLVSLLDSIGDGIFAVDAAKRIILYNQAALKILNLKGNIGEKDIDNILKINAKGRRISAVDGVLTKGTPLVRDDVTFISKEQGKKFYIYSNPVFNEEREVTGSIVLFRDITKQKKIEEEKEEFAAITSHELRTPVTLVEGYLHYILKSGNCKFDRNTKEYLLRAHDSCLDLIRLISDILTISKIEEGQEKITLEKIEILAFLRDLTKEFTGKARGEKLKLNFTNATIPKIYSIKVLTDKVKLRQVLSNLIENALKFTHKGSIEVKIEKEPDNLVVNVIDTGVGIEPADQKLIFSKFYRIEAWQSKATEGTGLGLYISKRLVERLGGEIGVESERGRGSRFYFTIPFLYPVKEDIQKLTKKELKEFVGNF